MIPQTLPDFPPRTRLFDVSATVTDAGGGIFVVCACMCVSVCFKEAVWFCSELTRAPEVIKIRRWRRPLERVGALRLLWLCMCVVACIEYMFLCMCWRAGVMCNMDSNVPVCAYAFK